MAYSMLFTSLVSQLINSWPNKKLLNYGYREQLKDILPTVILSACMGMIIYMIKWLDFSYALTLILQIMLGCIVYFGTSMFFKFEAYEYLTMTLKAIIKRK